MSRDELSTLVHNDARLLQDSHMDAYARIRTTILETTAAIDALPVTIDSEACLNTAKNRWNIQITRAGVILKYMMLLK